MELLATYSIAELLTIVVTLALAGKGLITFWDWAYGRVKQKFDEKNAEEKEQDALEVKIAGQQKQITELINNLNKTNQKLDRIVRKVDLLINSDKDAIKAYITREHHHFCYEQKWIDDYSLDCIEKRFTHYEDEGGNSFIEGLMEELRALPKIPPREDEEE